MGLLGLEAAARHGIDHVHFSLWYSCGCSQSCLVCCSVWFSSCCSPTSIRRRTSRGPSPDPQRKALDEKNSSKGRGGGRCCSSYRSGRDVAFNLAPVQMRAFFSKQRRMASTPRQRYVDQTSSACSGLTCPVVRILDRIARPACCAGTQVVSSSAGQQ